MEFLIGVNRRSSSLIEKMNGCCIEKIEFARDFSQAAPRGLLAHAVYFWTDRGLFCAYGDAYRGLPFHDFPSILLAEVSTEQLTADKDLRTRLDEIDGKNQQLTFIGTIFQRDMYAGTSPIFSQKMGVEYPCGLIFLFGVTAIALLASSVEPSLEVLTKDGEFSQLMEQSVRVESAW